MHTRSSGSTSASAAAAASATNMVGTPWKVLMFSFTISSIARAASNRGSSTSVAPARQVELSETVCPNAWKRGSAPRAMSSGRTSLASKAQTVAFITRLKWLSTAPLGTPVVPLV